MSESEEYSGSGTDSEPMKPGESDSDSGSGSGSGSEDTETRFLVVKNDGNKRSRENELKDSANKKVKTAAATTMVSSPATPAAGKDGKDAKTDGQFTPGSPAVKSAGAALATTTPNNNNNSSSNNTNNSSQVKPPVPKKAAVTDIVKKPVQPLDNKLKPKEESTPKKTPQTWTNEDELVLVSHLLKDLKSGIRPPKRGSRGENYHYWGDLHEACQGKFIAGWSKEQLYDKYRRTKSRYDSLVEKARDEGVSAIKFKNAGEEKVFNLWKQIYEMQEQDDPEPPPNSATKLDTKKPRLPAPTPAIPLKSSVPEEKKDVASSSSKKPKPVVAEPKQNGRASSAATTDGIATLQDLQNKSNATLEEMQSKVNSIMGEFSTRSQKIVQDMVKNAGGRVELLSDFLMLSMGRTNVNMEMPGMLTGGMGSGVLGFLGGVWDSTTPAATKLKELWLKQQAEELRVMEQRVRLLQDLCQHQQDMLRQAQSS